LSARLRFTVNSIKERKGRSSVLTLSVKNCICLGWSARDAAALQAHVEELAKLGIRGPLETPEVFVVSTRLVTTGSRIAVKNDETSGEVEYVLVVHGGRTYATVGSDHTDRRLEAKDILQSKRRYAKVISKNVWPLDEVIGHWDSLILRSWCNRDSDSDQELYQEASVSALIPPESVIRKLETVVSTTEDALVMSGTIPTVSEKLVFAQRFVMEMEDPVLGRSLGSEYEILHSRRRRNRSAR
jgi:hypothetical protein